MQAPAQLEAILRQKTEGERVQIAQRAGAQLETHNLPDDQRQAAEIMVRQLAQDAIELVRQSLSQAVRHARSLPRDIALRIAQDVDAVACPFLEVTEVLSEDDLQKLVHTVSPDALAAMARRTSLSEDLAVGIAERADPVAAETLVRNPAAPMTPRVCAPIMHRFRSKTEILDCLAERSDLGAEIATRLVAMVSEAAKQKLAVKYDLRKHVEPQVTDAEILSIVRLALKLPETRYPVILSTLRNKRKITPRFMELALREGSVAFFEALVTAQTGVPLAKVRGAVRQGKPELLTGLFHKLEIAAEAHDELLQHIMEVRETQDWLKTRRAML